MGKLAVLERLTAEVKRRFGSINADVANATVNGNGPFVVVTEGPFDEVFGVPVKGASSACSRRCTC